ncbi:MAG: YchF-related putative GTPase [Candidatus Hodarchaeales archaeon]|jgi:ribosome-binding ATPase YchF (GTP1/OBG family)
MVLIGVVGKPSAGKSTFLNALCPGANAKTGDYPFTTIDPNLGVGFFTVPCPCKELGVTCNPRNSRCENNTRFIPIKIIDVAGLVPGAHEGRGLGNKFLSELSEADILIHVIDASGSLNAEGESINPGSYDPVKDFKFLEEEIVQWINGILSKGWDKVVRRSRSLKAKASDMLHERIAGLKISKNAVTMALRELMLSDDLEKWSEDDILAFSNKIREISKPIIIAANKIDKSTAKGNIERLREEVGKENFVPVASLIEVILQKLQEDGKIVYQPLSGSIVIPNPDKVTTKEKGIVDKTISEIFSQYTTTGVIQVLNRCIERLNLAAVYPVADFTKFSDQDGNILPDVFLVPEGTGARKFAGMIHKDFEEKFVCAIDARTKKRLSEDYQVKDKDVLKIMKSN